MFKSSYVACVERISMFKSSYVSAYLQNLHECIYKTWKMCLLGTNWGWLNILIVGYESTILNLSIWNLLGPRFTFGNQIELEWRGFIKVLELGLNWPLVLEGLKIKTKSKIGILFLWFEFFVYFVYPMFFFHPCEQKKPLLGPSVCNPICFFHLVIKKKPLVSP
jgi:hypothetical protein